MWSTHSGCCVLIPLTLPSFTLPSTSPHPPSPSSRHGLQRVCHPRGSGHDDRGGEGGGGGCIDCWACFTWKHSYKHTHAIEGQESPAECSTMQSGGAVRPPGCSLTQLFPYSPALLLPGPACSVEEAPGDGQHAAQGFGRCEWELSSVPFTLWDAGSSRGFV